MVLLMDWCLDGPQGTVINTMSAAIILLVVLGVITVNSGLSICIPWICLLSHAQPYELITMSLWSGHIRDVHRPAYFTMMDAYVLTTNSPQVVRNCHADHFEHSVAWHTYRRFRWLGVNWWQNFQRFHLVNENEICFPEGVRHHRYK